MFPSMRILKLHGIFGGVVNSWKSLALVVLSHPERYQITEGTAAVAAFGCFSGRRTWSPRARCPARGGLHPKVIGRFVMFCSRHLGHQHVTMIYNACNMPGSVVP
jgi:hypothetical protein